MINVTPYILTGCILGGKLLSLLTLLPIIVSHDLEPWKIGFVFYGAFIGAVLGCGYYGKIQHANLYKYADPLCRLLPIGQAIGRIGCYLNGCCYGKEEDRLFSIKYYINGESVKVFTIQFIEAGLCLVLGMFLLKIEKEKGYYTRLHISLYAGMRYFLEFSWRYGSRNLG